MKPLTKTSAITNWVIGVALQLILFTSPLHAQYAVAASGGDISGSGGSISYTVGQVPYEMYLDASGSAALGVQQPNEIFVYPGIESPMAMFPAVNVFPNPVHNHLTIQLDEEPQAPMVVVFYDITGKRLESITLDGRQAQLDMSSYARAVYFLRLYHHDHSTRVFRVVKN